jgi:two-component system, OmpR family, response regulator
VPLFFAYDRQADGLDKHDVYDWHASCKTGSFLEGHMMDILLVDDDWQSLLSLGRFLCSEGHRVDAHQNPTSALEACENVNYDLLVSDYRLPEMDGLELIKAVKGKQPRIKTILYSGLYSTATLKKARKQGVDKVLGKPIYIQDLLAAIQYLALPLSGSGPAIFNISGKEYDVTL